MKKIENLLSEELSSFKENFNSFIKELIIEIENSKLFKNTGYSKDILKYKSNSLSIEIMSFISFCDLGIYFRGNLTYYPFGKFDFEKSIYTVANHDEFLKKFEEDSLQLNEDEKNFLKRSIKSISLVLDKTENEIAQRKNEFTKDKNSFLTEVDKDGDGILDLIGVEALNSILSKNQKTIIEIDKTYIQKFVKISAYLKTKRANLQYIFELIKATHHPSELPELLQLFRNQVHTYDLLLLHSMSMVTSLSNSDFITFYEIYECFDQLGVFNSNWENEVTSKLTNIGDGLTQLMYSINEMESRIVDSIENLTYMTEDAFRDLRISMEDELSSIGSSIGFNNLLTGIQAYQMYRVNQNTKKLN